MSEDLDTTTQILRLELPAAPAVLIVDDDELVLERLQELVNAAGYAVRTATSGAAALGALEQSAASIVITDLGMPGMDGLELCRRIRACDWPGYVYIVLLTVRDEERDILAGLDAGADDYLSKRTSAAQFTARLRTAQRVLALEYSLKNALEQNRKLAMTDPLTGVYNRRYFMRHLGRALTRVQRNGGRVSMLLVDVDYFKRVNDTHGHAVGDTVLKKLTGIIGACLRRATDWCARLGEEFAVVLEGATVAEARASAENLREAIAGSPFDAAGGSIRVTVSIGVAGLEAAPGGQPVTADALLEMADKLLYRSKDGGRNRVTAPRLSDGAVREPNQERQGHAKAKMAISTIR